MLVNIERAGKKFYQSTNFPQMSQIEKKPSEHFVIGDWNQLVKSVDKKINRVIVYEDFTALIKWIDLLGTKNVAYYHSDPTFTKLVAQQGIRCYTGDVNMIPKNLHGVGNPAFSISEEVLLNHPPSKSLCMVMEAKYVLAPNFEANGWKNVREIKQRLEDMGLKEVFHIPNGFFKQIQEDGKEKSAQVQSVLVITEPGYTGKVKVTNLHTEESFYLDRGSMYVKTSTILPEVELYGQGNDLKFRELQKQDEVATQWAIGVNVYNPNAKSSGADGNHLEGMKLFAPGDVMKKNTCYCYLDNETEAKKMFKHFTSKKVADAYQNLTTQKSFSGIVTRML